VPRRWCLQRRYERPAQPVGTAQRLSYVLSYCDVAGSALLTSNVRQMSRTILIAGIIALLTAMVHIFMGTPLVHRPLLSSALALDLRLLLYACWHLVSVMLLASAAFLLRACTARRICQSRDLIMLVGVSWIGFGVVFVAIGLSFPGALLRLPQWTLLLPVGVLCLLHLFFCRHALPSKTA
jgi:hypothetical protein